MKKTKAKSRVNKSASSQQFNLFTKSISSLVVGILIGLVISGLIHKDTPNVRVWAVDKTVKIPSGLENFLKKDANDDCRGYRGTGTPTGVALFAVLEAKEGKYAKMVYGCSDNLQPDTTILAVKHNGDWKLIPPGRIDFSYPDGSVAYRCEVLDKYGVKDVLAGECVTKSQRDEIMKHSRAL